VKREELWKIEVKKANRKVLKNLIVMYDRKAQIKLL
jgi:hypothetical protein